MPNPAITTSSAGDVFAQEILELMSTGSQTVEKGSLYIHDGVQDKVHLSRMKVSSDPLQDRQAQPTTPANAFTHDEKTITPLDCMFFDLINPREYESVWREFQPSGPLADKVLDPDVQRAILSVLAKSVNKQVDKLIWQGDTTAGATSPLRFFDGFIKLFAADSDVIDVTNVGAITDANVIAILDDCDQAIPDAIYDDPDVVFHMNTGNFRLYQAAARALTQKGPDIADAARGFYAGREVRHYAGLPANKIVVAKATAGPDSSLHAATAMTSDQNNILIEKYRPEGELYFVKILFKMAVNSTFGEEIVLYQGS